MSPVFRHGRLRLYLLRLLDEEPRHGYEVIRLLRDRFMGIYAPSPGTIYPRLARLEEEGLVTHDEENGRKVYRITEAGREELRKRSTELDELEAELSASVNDIVREVREDVRETVRTLREELTWAAREMRRGERESRDDVQEHAQHARDAAWAQARSVRDQARQARDQAKEETRQARDEAREQARQARDEARQAGEQAREQARAAREEAMRHAQWIREEATNLRDDAISRFRAIYEQAVGERDPWAQGTREDDASGPRGQAGRESEAGDRGHGQHDWGTWLGWDWRRWGDWPGRKSWPGPRDMTAFRDLEHLARDFAADMRKVAWESESLGGDVITALRGILEDTLERIKSEVFAHPPESETESKSETESEPGPAGSPAAPAEKTDGPSAPSG